MTWQGLVLPGVDLTDRDVEAGSNVFYCLITFRDDAYTLGNSLGCDWVITSHHDNLQHSKTMISKIMCDASWSKARISLTDLVTNMFLNKLVVHIHKYKYICAGECLEYFGWRSHWSGTTLAPMVLFFFFVCE